MKISVLAVAATLSLAGHEALAANVYDVTVSGGDAIFLAGRTDLTIPPADQPWGDNNAATEDGMRRHAGPTPEEVLETVPPFIPVGAGDVIKVLDPAIGGINFFLGFGPPFFGPEGNGGTTSSNLSGFGAISGYTGTQGALTGVFLSDDVPSDTSLRPATLDLSAIGRNFLSIAPLLNQVFFIGNGQTDDLQFQSFIAPTGATRLFFGIPDGFGFVGVPGAYDDNDGNYRVRVGVNTTPTPQVPLPAGGVLLITGLAGLGLLRRRLRG